MEKLIKSKVDEKRFGLKQEMKVQKVRINNLPQDISSFKTIFPRSLTEIHQIYSFKHVELEVLKSYVEKAFREDFEKLDYYLSDLDNFNRKIDWKYILTKGGKAVSALGITPKDRSEGTVWVHFGISNRFAQEFFKDRNILLEILEL